MEFLLHNGQMVNSGDFNPADLWLNQGFTVTEEMWFANGEIPFYDAHISRMAQIFSLFEKELPVGLPPWTELLRLFKRLINKNKAFMAGWLILKININNEAAGHIAFIRTFPNRSFPLDHEGKLCLFSPFQKLSTVVGKQFPFSSEWIRSAEYFRLGGDNNSISVILNEKGIVTESTVGNIFYIVKNSLFTPSPVCGCLLDLMRGKVIEAAQECGFQTMESEKTTPAALYEAEEIFTVSEREGFKWIRGIESKRYMKTKSHLVWRQINKRWFPEVS